MEMYRQGDVLIRKSKVDKGFAGKFLIMIPRDNGRVVLAYGEATGHAHAIANDGAFAYQFGNNILLELNEPSQLEHEEHGTIDLSAGTYEVIRQREWTDDDQQRWAYVQD